ncbi:MAG TPA: NAD(P)-binding domain-containing protein [Holophagaceae bacterium]|nr:NAD(P)-binding domain-containing protein [Holophagaceae bacterium]
MKIAMIGKGNVGQALAAGLRRAGHEVVHGVRAPERPDELPVVEAVAACELAVLAVPYTAALDVAAAIPDWGGKVLVDATNPILPGLSGLEVGTTGSGAERIAARAAKARVVKAFNTTGAENLAQAAYPGGRGWMPVAGDDGEARAVVLELAASLGFEAVDAGPLVAARYLEPFAMTWIHLAYRGGLGRGFAFGLLRR